MLFHLKKCLVVLIVSSVMYGCLTLELIVFLCCPDLFFRNKEPFVV